MELVGSWGPLAGASAARFGFLKSLGGRPNRCGLDFVSVSSAFSDWLTPSPTVRYDAVHLARDLSDHLPVGSDAPDTTGCGALGPYKVSLRDVLYMGGRITRQRLKVKIAQRHPVTG